MFEALACCLLFSVFCSILFSWVVVVQSKIFTHTNKVNEVTSQSALRDLILRDLRSAPVLLSEWIIVDSNNVSWRDGEGHKVFSWLLKKGDVVRGESSAEKTETSVRKSHRFTKVARASSLEFKPVKSDDGKKILGFFVNIASDKNNQKMVESFVCLRNRTL